MSKNTKLGVKAHTWLGTMAIVIVLVGAAMYTLQQVNTLQQINNKMYHHPTAASNAVISVDGRIYNAREFTPRRRLCQNKN